MKICPINSIYCRPKPIPVKYVKNKPEPVTTTIKTDVNFKGKHDCAKLLCGIFGTLGTVGAIGGMLIMTGGLGAATLPWIIGYGATSAGIGAYMGHQVDKDQNKPENK